MNDTAELRGITVLVVDDDPANAKLMLAVLHAEGCDVRTVGSAEDALKLLEVFKPRFIVLDLVLPVMSGLVLAHKLKTRSSTKDIVIVAVTAFDGPGAARAARDVGCDAYLPKPIDTQSFAKHLHRYLGPSASPGAA